MTQHLYPENLYLRQGRPDHQCSRSGRIYVLRRMTRLVQQSCPYSKHRRGSRGHCGLTVNAPDDVVNVSARHQVIVVEHAQDQLEKVNHHTSPIALVNGATA